MTLPANLVTELRRRGFSESAIATATERGKPLTEKKLTGRLPPKRQDLADSFCALWDRLGPKIPYQREFRFHETRRWRFDVAWPAQKVAIEMEGGIWSRGRHTRGGGYRQDMEKNNAAAILGWTVLQYCVNDLELSPVQTIEEVIRALENSLLWRK